MKYCSTNSEKSRVDLRQAIMQSLPEDGGLYLPEEIIPHDPEFIKVLHELDFPEICTLLSKQFLSEDFSDSEIADICAAAFTFPAPVVSLGNDIYSLELFHGPTMAFKDFGARYMAQLMSRFNKNSDKNINILVATSGDTGGAVASGFFEVDGVEVTILYPSGKVSPLQEKQLCSWGSNIQALEIDGTFDDCQAMVKLAFLDKDLGSKLQLSSANSINIGRLIPQSFYYFEAFKQLPSSQKLMISVPSGNFGNLTAGYMAKMMGLPIDSFVAATNINKVVPEYIESGDYEPRPSKRTISNAMDVGDPSNFRRLLKLTGSTWNNFKMGINGYFLDDLETKQAMQYAWSEYGYICDPHGAIAFDAHRKLHSSGYNFLFLETAHPAKFKEIVDEVLGKDISLPENLRVFLNKEKHSVKLSSKFEDLKEWLLNSY